MARSLRDSECVGMSWYVCVCRDYVVVVAVLLYASYKVAE